MGCSLAHLPVMEGSALFSSRSSNCRGLESITDATVFMGVPTYYTRLLDAGIGQAHAATVRLFTSGSAPLLPQTFSAFEEATGHTIVERYGMTETGMNTSNPFQDREKPERWGYRSRG